MHGWTGCEVSRRGEEEMREDGWRQKRDGGNGTKAREQCQNASKKQTLMFLTAF